VRFFGFSRWILREDGSTDKASSRKDSIGGSVGLGGSRAFFLDFSVDGLLSRMIGRLIIVVLGGMKPGVNSCRRCNEVS
jgi:hypothetical protein